MQAFILCLPHVTGDFVVAFWTWDAVGNTWDIHQRTIRGQYRIQLVYFHFWRHTAKHQQQCHQSRFIIIIIIIIQHLYSAMGSYWDTEALVAAVKTVWTGGFWNCVWSLQFNQAQTATDTTCLLCLRWKQQQTRQTDSLFVLFVCTLSV